jgi:hypothetical protein
MAMSTVEQARAEQLQAVAKLAANPKDKGALLWLNDWFMEELLIEEAPIAMRPSAGATVCASAPVAQETV